MVRTLNEMQRHAFEFILKWCREKRKSSRSVKPTQVDPIYIFVTGGAGSGKSHLIKTVYQLALKPFKGSSEHLDQEYPSVLLLAPTGVAAINIHGTTVNSGLAIPKKVYGNNVPPLSDARKTSIRTKLSNLTLIIIDEISMVSNNRLKHVHERLQEIFCTSNSQMFAGINIVAVGDFFQLPPVKAFRISHLYPDPALNSFHPWLDNFKMVELTETMRQKGDLSLPTCSIESELQ